MLRLQAARYHKTSIDALLHPRHRSATPYRVVLGDVSLSAVLLAHALHGLTMAHNHCALLLQKNCSSSVWDCSQTLVVLQPF